MENQAPEKAQLLETLQKKGLNVPDFIYVPAKEFISGDFKQLESFLTVISRFYIMATCDKDLFNKL